MGQGCESAERYVELDKIDDQLDSQRYSLQRANVDYADLSSLLERMIGYLKTGEKDAPVQGAVQVANCMTWEEIKRAYAQGAPALSLAARRWGRSVTT